MTDKLMGNLSLMLVLKFTVAKKPTKLEESSGLMRNLGELETFSISNHVDILDFRGREHPSYEEI